MNADTQESSATAQAQAGGATDFEIMESDPDAFVLEGALTIEDLSAAEASHERVLKLIDVRLASGATGANLTRALCAAAVEKVCLFGDNAISELADALRDMADCGRCRELVFNIDSVDEWLCDSLCHFVRNSDCLRDLTVFHCERMLDEQCAQVFAAIGECRQLQHLVFQHSESVCTWEPQVMLTTLTNLVALESLTLALGQPASMEFSTLFGVLECLGRMQNLKELVIYFCGKTTTVATAVMLELVHHPPPKLQHLEVLFEFTSFTVTMNPLHTSE